jgi:hypothetical protein
MSSVRTTASLLGILVVLGLTGCASSGPDSGPQLERVGVNMIQYTGPELDVTISYTFANDNLGEPWLMLQASMTGALRRATQVRHESIFVITPQGERIALATQQEFDAAISELQTIIHRAGVASEPLGYMGGDKQRCILPFIITPPIKLRYRVAHAELLFVTDRQLCSGPLFFPIRGGVKPGGWIFGIDLRKSQVRIPFILGEESGE